jgi:protein-S-isoprenylcysteine O-methyltransferase Ste14
MNILILAAYIAVWGLVHSLQASTGIKTYFRHRLGPSLDRAYRFMYNILSVIGFAPVIVLMRILPDQEIYTVPAPWRFIMYAGQALALLLLFVTFLQTDALAFIGLRQLIEDEKPAMLITNGFYHWVRHPLYLFGLLILWLTPFMTINMLVVYISLTVYLLGGAYFEERKLSREFGAAYTEYKSHTPMIVPGFVFKRN